MDAYSYLRFSHAKQSKGDSLRRQREKTTALCKRKGWKLDEGFSLEDKGVSARYGKNADIGALGAFLAAVQGGKVATPCVLVIESLDRLSRSQVMEAVELFMGILRMGVVIATTDPERVYDSKSMNDQPFTLFEPILIFIRANEENERRIGRVAASWEKRRNNAREKPMSKRCPSWLTPKNGGFVPIPERAERLRWIFDQVCEGNTLHWISQQLNKDNVAYWGKDKWDVAWLAKVIRSRTVLGEMQPKKREGSKRVAVGQPLPGYYPRIIEDKQYFQAQGQMASRRKNKFVGRTGKDTANLFTGLCYDARDGYRMKIKVSQTMHMLVSTGHLAGKTESLGIHYKQFETAFLLMCKELVWVEGKKKNHEKEIDAYKEELRHTLAQSERIQNELVEGGALKALSEVLRKLAKKEENLKDAIARLEAEKQQDANSDLQGIKTVLQKIEEGESDEENRRILRNRIRALVDSIWVLTGSESRWHRRATVQVFWKAGGHRFIQIELKTRGKNAGMEARSCTGEELGVNVDLPHWRERLEKGEIQEG